MDVAIIRKRGVPIDRLSLVSSGHHHASCYRTGTALEETLNAFR
jgi:hypothetical protein